MDSTPLNSFVHRPFGRFVWNVESTRKTILFLETSDSGAGNTILFLCTKDKDIKKENRRFTAPTPENLKFCNY